MPHAHPYHVRVVHHLPSAAVKVLVGLVAFILVVIIGSFFVDGPLRRSIERGMNDALKGYTVSVEKAHLNIFGPSVTLSRTIVRQDITDGRTVALLPRLRASLQ